MKLESISSFYHNATFNQAQLKIIALSGAKADELLPIMEFINQETLKKWQLPDDLGLLSQMNLFQTEQGHLFIAVDKLKKKDVEFFISILSSLEGVIYLLSTTSSALEPFYQQWKNQMLWLDLSQEKPWQKKDRYLFLLQAEAKREGYTMDKSAASYLLDNEEGHLDRAKSRLASCMLLGGLEKKITLDLVKALLPKAEVELDFAWVDQLLFKQGPLEKPYCKEPSDLLLFLGQIRYALTNALKIKSLQLKKLSQEEMKPYFPKLSFQALSMQIKKSEEVPLSYIEAVLQLVFMKELQLKQDFQQPSAIFIELIAKICEQKLCLKPES